MELKAKPGGCEEASLLSGEKYIPCNKLATRMIGWPNEGPYRMCEMCADHSIRNRNAKDYGPYRGDDNNEDDNNGDEDKMSSGIEKLGTATETLKWATQELAQEAERAEKSNEFTELLVFFFHLKNAYAAMDEARKGIYRLVDQLDKAAIPAGFERLGADKIRVPEVERSFYVLDKSSASLVDKAKGYDWLRGHGGEEIITETVNAGTLAKFLREMLLEQGLEPPPEVIKVSTYQVTGMSKYTPKK